MEKVLIEFIARGGETYYRQWPVSLLPSVGDDVILKIGGVGEVSFNVVKRTFLEKSPEHKIVINLR